MCVSITLNNSFKSIVNLLLNFIAYIKWFHLGQQSDYKTQKKLQERLNLHVNASGFEELTS